MIRYLLANNGTSPIDTFETYFKPLGLYEEHLNRLLNRELIAIADKRVHLKENNYKKGLQNRIMMWGTRRMKDKGL